MYRYFVIAILLGIGCNATLAESVVREEPIMLRTKDCDLQGTLTIPTAGTARTVVLIVADSGPTDRNGNQKMMLNNSLKMYAHELAQQNIASLRYDKRGVAASQIVNNNARIIDLNYYIDDVKEWVKLLRRDARFNKIVIAGHTEGALLAMAAISDGCKVDGYISIAGMGQTVDNVLKDRYSNGPEQIKEVAFAIIDSLKAGKITYSIPLYLRNSFAPALQKYIMNLFDYDPDKMIRHINIPTLLLQGDKDLQINIEDVKMLSAANPKAKLVIVPGMNHVFKECSTMNPQEQMETLINPSFPLVPKFVEVSVEFINSL